MSRLARASATTSSNDASRGAAAAGGDARGGGETGRAAAAATGPVGRLRELAKRLFGARKVGSIRKTDQRHLSRSQRTGRIVHILRALEQDLPGPRQDSERELAGKLARALALDLA